MEPLRYPKEEIPVPVYYVMSVIMAVSLSCWVRFYLCFDRMGFPIDSLPEESLPLWFISMDGYRPVCMKYLKGVPGGTHETGIHTGRRLFRFSA